MKTKLQKAQKEITKVFLEAWQYGDFALTEFQPELNDKTRQLIKAFNDQHGQAWLGQVNLYGKDRGKKEAILKKYNGFVYNFEASFIVPQYDQKLVDMIFSRDTTPYTTATDDYKLITEIMDYIESIGGLNLHWV